MSISYQVLGAVERDNALLVRIDSGQSLDWLLFDCGEGCLWELTFAEIQAIDHLCFSHLHMDHVGGFDSFVRCNFARESKANVIWGPPETARILQGRFRGYMWNLYDESPVNWLIHDVYEDHIQSCRLALGEAFAHQHDAGRQAFTGTLIDTPTYTVEALHMNHRTPSLAYIVREKPRHNIDAAKLQQLGLRPGPWLKQIKEPLPDETPLDISGQVRSLGEWRHLLLVESAGDSIAYLTDFLLDEAALARLTPALKQCRTVVCESQYRQQDEELARLNYHVTTTQVAELAKRADVGELVLFHLSDRYTADERPLLLEEARAVFPKARFPEKWGIDIG